jgi:hypothetical protein
VFQHLGPVFHFIVIDPTTGRRRIVGTSIDLGADAGRGISGDPVEWGGDVANKATPGLAQNWTQTW